MTRAEIFAHVLPIHHAHLKAWFSYQPHIRPSAISFDHGDDRYSTYPGYISPRYRNYSTGEYVPKADNCYSEGENTFYRVATLLLPKNWQRG